MKGVSSFDGKLHGNSQTVDRYNEAHGKKPQRAHETGGESGGAHEAEGHDEIKQVVAEHGPAHTVHVRHDHEAQHSHVVSHHGSGHKHEAHFDGEGHEYQAHAHAAHAAGAHDSEELHQHHSDMGDEAGERSEERAEEEDSPGIHARIGAGEGFMGEEE